MGTVPCVAGAVVLAAGLTAPLALWAILPIALVVFIANARNIADRLAYSEALVRMKPIEYADDPEMFPEEIDPEAATAPSGEVAWLTFVQVFVGFAAMMFAGAVLHLVGKLLGIETGM